MRRNSVLTLDSRFRHRFTRCLEAVQKLYPEFRIFETYRSPEDQDREYAEGDSKLRAGQSAHQYGLAADFVPVDEDGDWYWPPWEWAGWDALEVAARANDLLTPIEWDRPHVEVPEWRAIRKHGYKP